MTGTETALWRALSKAQQPRDLFTRIETGGTVGGVSDVEYVLRASGHHGWIELKTFSTDDDTRAIRLHSPFTFPQASWLLAHHMPERKLISWLLLGRLGPRTWRELILVPPDIAVTHLMSGRRTASVEKLIAARTTMSPHAVVRCKDAREAMRALRVA